MYYLVSILLGLVPEVLYFTLFMCTVKRIKEKRIKLFLLISIAYFICALIQQYQLLFHILFLSLIYISLKVLYKNKTQIIDVFIIGLAYFWIAILSFFLTIALKLGINYYFLYIVDRILLVVPILLANKYNELYIKYRKSWNRNDNEKRAIKSITLRNISLIILNSIIVLSNITIYNIINLIK